MKHPHNNRNRHNYPHRRCIIIITTKMFHHQLLYLLHQPISFILFQPKAYRWAHLLSSSSSCIPHTRYTRFDFIYLHVNSKKIKLLLLEIAENHSIELSYKLLSYHWKFVKLTNPTLLLFVCVLWTHFFTENHSLSASL